MVLKFSRWIEHGGLSPVSVSCYSACPASELTSFYNSDLTVKALQLRDVQAVVTVEIGQDLRIVLICDVIAMLSRVVTLILTTCSFFLIFKL